MARGTSEKYSTAPQVPSALAGNFQVRRLAFSGGVRHDWLPSRYGARRRLLASRVLGHSARCRGTASAVHQLLRKRRRHGERASFLNNNVDIVYRDDGISYVDDTRWPKQFVSDSSNPGHPCSAHTTRRATAGSPRNYSEGGYKRSRAWRTCQAFPAPTRVMTRSTAHATRISSSVLPQEPSGTQGNLDQPRVVRDTAPYCVRRCSLNYWISGVDSPTIRSTCRISAAMRSCEPYVGHRACIGIDQTDRNLDALYTFGNYRFTAPDSIRRQIMQSSQSTFSSPHPHL